MTPKSLCNDLNIRTPDALPREGGKIHCRKKLLYLHKNDFFKRHYVMVLFTNKMSLRNMSFFKKKKTLYIFIFRVPASLHTACAERSLLTGLLPNSFLLSLYVFCGPCSLGKSLGTSHYSTPGFQPCYGTIFFFLFL